MYSHFFPHLIIITVLLTLPNFSSSSQNPHQIPPRKLADSSSSSSCPLNFTILRRFFRALKTSDLIGDRACQYVIQGIHLVESEYLKSSNFFLPPLNTSESCWDSYQSILNEFIKTTTKIDIRIHCGFQTSWISEGCMNISSRIEFESKIPESVMDDIRQACNQSLENNSPCATCTTSLSRLQATYLNGLEVGNVTDCSVYPFIYAAALVNQFGPTDDGNLKCLFSFDVLMNGSSNKKRKKVIMGVLIGFGGFISLGLFALWFLLRRRKKRGRRRKLVLEARAVSGLDSMSASTTLVKYDFEEIKQATKNFSRHNIIGMGGYGNVYKGTLRDGSEVAMKRFKNCSVAGDASFTHEVEVIASVKHVNLLSLKGYCTATAQYEGHQRIIVCDLVCNGSLHDHLFSLTKEKLSWPIRQKIALGTARGLAYLHYGAQPSIIHRDIKASNILLDENFEPKLADFGLAKFTPEGMTHLSTRVAGTMGYVAPEYALYGQLTERSDVYSFGVVLLELLSGKKALIATNENKHALVTDWAWSLVRTGRALDVIEEGMTDLGPPEIMEKYVMVAVLSSHPQLYARPTMDQIVKIMETDLPVPSIPERSISIISEIDDIERSISNSGSGNLSSSSGYQAFTQESDYRKD